MMLDHNGERRRRLRAHRWALIAVLALAGGLVMGSAQTGQNAYVVPVREASQRAIDQLTLAIRVALIAPETPTLDDMKLSAARILNILVGEQSEFYQKNIENVQGADGVGVIPRLQQIRASLGPYASSNAEAQSMLYALNGIEFFTTVARDELRAALSNRDERQVRFALRRLFAFLATARGNREDPLSEGGTRALNAQVDRQ